MCVCVCVCIYIVLIYIYMYMHMYIYIHTHTHTHTNSSLSRATAEKIGREDRTHARQNCFSERVPAGKERVLLDLAALLFGCARQRFRRC